MRRDCPLKNRLARLALGALAISLLAPFFTRAEAAAADAQKNGASEMNRPMKLAAPVTVLLSPKGGRLDFSQRLDVERLDGKSVVSFAVPVGASNLQIDVVGRVMQRFSMEPVPLDVSTRLADLRRELFERKTDLEARLLAVEAEIALLQRAPERAGAQEIQNLQQTLAAALPRLGRERTSLQKSLEEINQELADIPANQEIGRRVSVVLQDDGKRDDKAEVHYSYMVPDCGWRALYEFNARPQEGASDVVDVKLLAEVWQYSGTDWTDASITLATRGQGAREPAPLPEWVIDSSPKAEPRAAPMMLNAVRAKDSAAGAVETAEGRHAPVIADTQSVYASWTLTVRDMPEGRSRLAILSDAWNAPLEWLARPGRDGGQVFLMARYDLPAGSAWPQGMAEYCVNGQSIGAGPFRPSGGEAVIYFGADPRVSVETTTDARTRGEKGFINTSKSWTWAWTYTIFNEHDKPIKVRLERPMPVIVDQSVSVSYHNRPEAQIDEKKHYLYWIVDVPAHGKASVEHGLTISSPTKLPLLPDVP